MPSETSDSDTEAAHLHRRGAYERSAKPILLEFKLRLLQLQKGTEQKNQSFVGREEGYTISGIGEHKALYALGEAALERTRNWERRDLLLIVASFCAHALLCV